MTMKELGVHTFFC